MLYQVGLDEERYRLVKGFSTGMKQRVKLAQAIVHDPELVFLDEPTNGHRPLGREEILGLIAGSPTTRQSPWSSPIFLTTWNGSATTSSCSTEARLLRPQPLHTPVDDTADLHVRVDGDPDPFLRHESSGSRRGRLASSTRRTSSSSLSGVVTRRWMRSGMCGGENSLTSRLLRPATRSLEELYVDSVGAGANGTRDKRQSPHR